MGAYYDSEQGSGCMTFQVHTRIYGLMVREYGLHTVISLVNRNIEILTGNQYKALTCIWAIVVVVGVVVVIVVVLADVGNCKLKIE